MQVYISMKIILLQNSQPITFVKRKIKNESWHNFFRKCYCLNKKNDTFANRFLKQLITLLIYFLYANYTTTSAKRQG